MKVLRTILLALLLSLLLGLAIGTVLRLRLERPVVYLMSALLPPLPLDVRHPGPPILDSSHHEQQIG